MGGRNVKTDYLKMGDDEVVIKNAEQLKLMDLLKKKNNLLQNGRMKLAPKCSRVGIQNWNKCSHGGGGWWWD